MSSLGRERDFGLGLFVLASISLVALSVIVVACSKPQDRSSARSEVSTNIQDGPLPLGDELARRLVGAWTSAGTNRSGDLWEQEVILQPGGTLQFSGKLATNGRRTRFHGNGTWKVEGSNYIETVTSCSLSDFPLNQPHRCEVMSLTDQQWTYLGPGSRVIVKQRKR